MRGEEGVLIKNRTAWFTSYPKCFVGSAAVDWMVEKNKAKDRVEAVAFGEQLIQADLVHHVSDNAGFSDDKAWFRFRADDEQYDGMSFYGQSKLAACLKAGPVQHKKGFGWDNRAAVVLSEPAQFMQYDSVYASKPSKIISLKQAALDLAECEDCKKDFHCFSLSGGDDQIRHVYCTKQSKDQQAFMEALTTLGVTLQREDLHSTANSLFEFNASRVDGTVVQFSEYTGKVCMVVNVASYWGLTKAHYEQFVALYEKYHDQGFEILAFPSNEFGKQEPKSNEEIQKFVADFGVKFPVFAKTTVNGKHAHPVFNFLRAKLTGLLGAYIKWNFTKFLCDRDGIPIKRYAPPTKPNDCEEDIVALLNKPASNAAPQASSSNADATAATSSSAPVEQEIQKSPRSPKSKKKKSKSPRDAASDEVSTEAKPQETEEVAVEEAAVEEKPKPVESEESAPSSLPTAEKPSSDHHSEGSEGSNSGSEGPQFITGQTPASAQDEPTEKI